MQSPECDAVHSAGQTELDIDAEDARLRNDPMQARTDSSGWTNFSTFLDRGGKILFYHGVSDAWFSAYDTLGFYQRAGEANEGWSDASRYYHVPGMGHCAVLQSSVRASSGSGTFLG